MFIAALFTIAKLWKHPRCPTTDERDKQTKKKNRGDEPIQVIIQIYMEMT
jgi:hypothetical protein